MKKKKNNALINMLVNIIIPIIILTRFSKETSLGPVYGLIVALSFPLIFGLYELLVLKHKNFISVLGFVGILFTGMVGLLKFPPHWVAVKEAAIPILIGIVVLISTKTSWQLIRKFLYNKELINIDLIESRLATDTLQSRFDSVLRRANVLFSLSFIFSGVLNFILAKIIVKSMPGTAQFNAEIGKMTMLSFPVIAIPSVIILMLIFRYLITSVKSLTHLQTGEIFSSQLTKNN